jgi:hypothetical protein
MIVGKMGLNAITVKAGPKSDVRRERTANGIVPPNWIFGRHFNEGAVRPENRGGRLQVGEIGSFANAV